MTEKDEYKITVCSLTNEECSVGDCSTCGEAMDETHDARMREHELLTPTNLSKKHDFVYSHNDYNTIALFKSGRKLEDIAEALQLPDRKVKPVRYDMSRLLIRWPHFVKLKYILSLGVPEKLVEMGTFLFAYYGDDMFVTAPRLTDEEFENSK